jgi:MFS family permease
MLALLRRRPAFRRLWLASTVSLLGDWLGFVAVSLLALDKGGGALALALVFAVHSLPNALFMPLAGVVADRLDRRRLLIAVPLVQAALTVAMALAAASGALWAVQGLVLVRSAASAFMMPAEMAALRHTVEPDELVPANALLSATWSVAYVVGMALGGALAVLGPVPAILIDASSFLVVALLLRSLPAMRAAHEAAGARAGMGALIAAVPRDLWSAFVHALGHRALFRSVFAKAPVALANGGGWVVLNLVAGQSPFGSAAISLGVLQAVRGAGTGLGPLGVSRWAGGGRAAQVAEHLAVACGFAGIGLFPLAQGAPGLLLVLVLVWGLGVGSNWVVSSAALQRHAPDHMIGRLSSLDNVCVTLLMVLSAVVGGAAIERGARLTVVPASGVALGVLGWVLLVWLSPTAAAGRAETGDAVASREGPESTA